MVSTKPPVCHTQPDDQALTSALLPQHALAQASNSIKGEEVPVEAIAPLTFDDAVLFGFRQGNREHATSTAEKTLNAGVSATEKILQMAGWIQEMKLQLSRKEFGAFVNGLLQWVGEEARKYLDIARTFKDFDLTQLQKIEPFTLLKLRSKRYLPVVERLREETDITPRRVQELILELIPKQPRRKRAKQEDNEHQEYAGGVLERHADASSGTFYYTLKELQLSDSVGSWLSTKLESQNIGQILAEVASRPPRDYVLDQLQELQDVVEQARSLDAENRKLMHQLQQQERRIAQLEAKLAERVAGSSDEVVVASTDVSEYLEDQVPAIAPDHITEYSSQTTEATENEKPKQEFDYLQLAQENDYLVQTEEDGENLEPEPQVFQERDRVEIVSSRQGAEFVWQIGVVKVAHPVGCVVEVLGKTLWFCVDELVWVY